MSHQEADQIAPQGETCGNCHFGVIPGSQLMERTCFGAPPTPVLVAAQPMPGGGVQMRLELVRPTLKATERGCAVWRRKKSLVIPGA